MIKTIVFVFKRSDPIICVNVDKKTMRFQIPNSPEYKCPGHNRRGRKSPGHKHLGHKYTGNKLPGHKCRLTLPFNTIGLREPSLRACGQETNEIQQYVSSPGLPLSQEYVSSSLCYHFYIICI